MSKLYLYNYNNYFNRIIKKEVDLASYGTPLYQLENTNFNYNDGVETSHDINYNKEEGDYVIITEVIDNIETIISRWFVIENQRLRGGQHRLQLRRDLIVDNYSKIINSPMIIDRAMLKNHTNPLLYNPEGFSFNQIKKKEIPLWDSGRIQWYVLYFKEIVDGNNNPFSGQIVDPSIVYDLVIPEFSLQSGTYYRLSDLNLNVKYSADAGGFNPTNTYKLNMSANGNSNDFQYYGWNGNNILFSSFYTIDTVKPAMTNAFENKYSDLLPLLLNDIGGAGINESTYELYKSYNGKIISDPTNNKVYRITINETLISNESYLSSGEYRNEVKSIIDSTSIPYEASELYTETAGYSYNGNYLDIRVEDITSQYALDWVLDFSNKIITIDSDFAIIAIPVENSTLYNGIGVTYQQNSLISKQLVKDIIKVAGENCVDVQVLPYCPVQDGVIQTTYGNTIDLDNLYPKQYDILSSNNVIPDNTTCIFYVQNSNFTFDIRTTLNIEDYTNNEALNRKIDNECKLYKLVSPNYNGSFEFSLAKNGNTEYFNVDVSLIPFTPYIHINPRFAELYGQDFNDSRGLICGGDFSLPRRENQWTQYKINNKNYQEIFDRQMRNMDFVQGQERTMSIIEALTGTITAGAGGVAGGLMSAGPAGAIAGGLIGGGASLIGGIADIGMISARQQEQKSFAIDNFKYQLGNIKALPDNITKVTPFNYNYKKFPFIEVYSATEEEINLFVNYLTFRSMKVNAIGKIFDYLDTEKHFIKGNLIRLEEFDLCSHEAFEIYKEIEEGVYI